MCEVRGVDGRGNYQYTLASGSIHPSGLKIERIGNEPYTIKSEEEIYKFGRLLAFADVMVRHWGMGSRSNLALGVSGFLLKNGYEEDEIRNALQGICELSGGDPKSAEISNTVRKFENGQPVAGEKILKENLPNYVFDRVKSWFSDNLLALADFDLKEILGLELEKRWPYLVYLAEMSRYTCDGYTLLKRTDVNDLFARQLDVKSRNAVMAMSHKLNGLGYFPGSELISTKGPSTYWNTWRPSTLESIKGDVSIFLDHVKSICDDEPEATSALLSFMAHAVQKPEQKVRWMILLIGGQGSGKTTIGDILGQLVGMSNFASIPATDMLGNFNSPLKNKMVVMIEEMRISRSTQTTALATALKEKVTNDVLLVKEKNVPEYYINNVIRFIGTSNHPAPIEIEPGDRRYYIIKSKTTGQPMTHKERVELQSFFTKYRHWLHAEQGLEKILNYLLNYDISKFTPDGAPAMSAVQQRNKLEIQQQTSLPEYFNEVNEHCEESDNEMVSFRTFKDSFDQRFPSIKISDKQFSSLVIVTGARKIRHKISMEGRKITVSGFLLRNLKKYQDNTVPEIAKILVEQNKEDF